MNFQIITKSNPLILASDSPRRKRLLTQAGIPFRSVSTRVNEKEVTGDPTAMSGLLGEKKALEGHSQGGPYWTLGADTIVELQCGDDSFLARVDPQIALRPRQETVARFDTSRSHLFDPNNEQVIVGP